MSKTTTSVLKVLSHDYEELKGLLAADAKAIPVAETLQRITETALDFLSSTSCSQVSLVSKVAGKEYYSFVLKGRGKPTLSRPVNRSLFTFATRGNLNHIREGTLQTVPREARNRLLYTTAMSYCCTSDLLKTRDQKTPATYFECLIGHLLAKTFGVNPRTQVEVLRLEEEKGTLPTDFIFDLGQGKPKFHVPVKTSTRERVIQVFAHQRVLDGVHGFGKFRGVLVCLTETKLDHRTKEVVEICVPKQWNLYQRFIAPMHRFYYFDIPTKYAELSAGDPPMAVLPFAKFFEEAEDLATGR